ncbi:PLA2G [Mytilus coruscus]|uniref:Phospholipase A2 n=1 Tax=Mytilus coruscus TaxID=42192 RepID=A0A6J8E4P3_MYTCO|nr:PLA2G [Mytilus coruscus]
MQFLRNIAACLLCIMMYSYKGEARTARHKRSLRQLEHQLGYLFGAERATALLDYGCYCGWSGKSDPLDGVDQCCKDHDDCYDREHGCLPKTLVYPFNLGNKTVNCEDSPNSCEGRVYGNCSIILILRDLAITDVFVDGMVVVHPMMALISRSSQFMLGENMYV